MDEQNRKVIESEIAQNRQLARYAPDDETAWRINELDDRFHEPGMDNAGIHGTRSVLVDSSFEKN